MAKIDRYDNYSEITNLIGLINAAEEAEMECY